MSKCKLTVISLKPENLAIYLIYFLLLRAAKGQVNQGAALDAIFRVKGFCFSRRA